MDMPADRGGDSSAGPRPRETSSQIRTDRFLRRIIPILRSSPIEIPADFRSTFGHEDAVQEALMVILRRIEFFLTLRPRALRACVRRILRWARARLIRRELARKRRAKMAGAGRDHRRAGLATAPSFCSGPYETADRREASAALAAGLAALPLAQRRVMALRYGDGLSNHQIAGVLAITPKAVERRIARGRANLFRACADRRPTASTRPRPTPHPNLRPRRGL